MSVIYLGKKDGTQSKHSEDELQSMRASGTLDPSWLYWQMGMPEWRPVSAWLEENPPPLRGFLDVAEESSPDLTAENSPITLRKNPVLISQILQLLLAMVGLICAVELLGSIWEIRILLLPANMQLAARGAFILAQFAVNLVSAVTTIPTIVFFCIWTYRIKANAWAFSTGFKISPGWAVGWFFIPFFNLVRPWQSMREAWQATENPKNWNSRMPTPLVNWWWGIWASCSALGFIGQQFVIQAAQLKEQGQDPLQMHLYSGYVNIVSAVAGIAVCILALLMVRELTRLQVVLVQTQVEPAQNPATLPRP